MRRRQGLGQRRNPRRVVSSKVKAFWPKSVLKIVCKGVDNQFSVRFISGHGLEMVPELEKSIYFGWCVSIVLDYEHSVALFRCSLGLLKEARLVIKVCQRSENEKVDHAALYVKRYTFKRPSL